MQKLRGRFYNQNERVLGIYIVICLSVKNHVLVLHIHFLSDGNKIHKDQGKL